MNEDTLTEYVDYFKDFKCIFESEDNNKLCKAFKIIKKILGKQFDENLVV